MCITECHTLETNTTLLVNYTPIKNNFFFKKGKYVYTEATSQKGQAS